LPSPMLKLPLLPLPRLRQPSLPGAEFTQTTDETRFVRARSSGEHSVFITSLAGRSFCHLDGADVAFRKLGHSLAHRSGRGSHGTHGSVGASPAHRGTQISPGERLVVDAHWNLRVFCVSFFERE
jgi:hypothetical protein